MNDNFKVVDGAIGASVPPNSSFTFPYPDATNQDSFYPDGHLLILNGQRDYSDPELASITFEEGVVRVTNLTGLVWYNGDTYEIQLNTYPVERLEGDLRVSHRMFVAGSEILSQSPGVVFDADVLTGETGIGGEPIDNTAAITAFIATITPSNPKTLALQGGMVTAGMQIPSYGNFSIIGRGLSDGIFNKSGSNFFGISNHTLAGTMPFDYAYSGNYPNPGAPAVTNAGSVNLENFLLNGNLGTINGLTGVVDGALGTAVFDGASYIGSFTGTGSEKGYASFAPAGTINIGTGAFPSAVGRTGEYRIITNGRNSNDVTFRDGNFVVAARSTGAAWIYTGQLWLTAIDFITLQHVRMRDLCILDSPAYGIRLSNVSDIDIENVIIKQTIPRVSGNDDCLHINGPCRNVRIVKLTLINGQDDAININGAEGYGGTMENVLIEQADFQSFGGILIYGDVRNAIIKNCSKDRGPFCRMFASGVGNIVFERNTLTSTAANQNFFGLLGSFGATKTTKSLTFRGNRMVGVSHTFCYLDAAASTTNEVVFENNVMEMTTAFHANAPIFGLYSGHVANKVIFNGHAIINPTGSTYAITNAIDMNNGSIGELVINSINPAYITNLVSSWTNISRVSGSGLLASGFPIPNVKMVNGVPYISQESGRASIKTGGTTGGLDGTVTELASSISELGSFLLTEKSLIRNDQTDFIMSADSANFGTADFTCLAFVKIAAFGTNNHLIFGKPSSFGFNITNTGAIVIESASASSTTLVPLNKWTCIAAVRAAGVVTYYVNGIAAGTATSSTNFTGLNRVGYANNSGVSYFLARLSAANYALTAAQILALYQNDGLWSPVQQGGSQTPVTAGSFVAANQYQILTIGTTDFTLIGAATNTVGLIFISTGVGSGTGTAKRAGTLYAPDDFDRYAANGAVKDRSGTAITLTCIPDAQPFNPAI